LSIISLYEDVEGQLVEKFLVKSQKSEEYFAKGTNLHKIQKVMKVKAYTFFNSELTEVEDEELK
jgi:hypothetical protein